MAFYTKINPAYIQRIKKDYQQQQESINIKIDPFVPNPELFVQQSQVAKFNEQYLEQNNSIDYNNCTEEDIEAEIKKKVDAYLNYITNRFEYFTGSQIADLRRQLKEVMPDPEIIKLRTRIRSQKRNYSKVTRQD